MNANPHGISLEPEAQKFVEETSTPPFLYQLPPEEGRAEVEKVQDEPIPKPSVEEERLTIEGGPTGHVRLWIVRPPDAKAPLPVILYCHGAGWVFGSAHTHDRLVRDLATGVGAAVVFPEYDRAPEAKYPTQNEQAYCAAEWVLHHGSEHGLDPDRMIAAGDSVGGNMSIALTLLGHARDTLSFRGLVLFYPVTDATFDTDSYQEFAEGYYLARDGMKWFWDQYTEDADERRQVTASPLRATPEQLSLFPPTLVITAEADVLRDEGEKFAAKLRDADVDVTQVRYGGIIHDFVMLNALHETPQAKAAIRQSIGFMRTVLGTTR